MLCNGLTTSVWGTKPPPHHPPRRCLLPTTIARRVGRAGDTSAAAAAFCGLAQEKTNPLWPFIPFFCHVIEIINHHHRVKLFGD